MNAHIFKQSFIKSVPNKFVYYNWIELKCPPTGIRKTITVPQKLFGTEVKQIVNTFDSMHESPRHSSKGKSHPQNVLFIRDSETDKTSLG